MRINRWGACTLLLAGPLFLAANVVVGLGWHHPSFSWATNNISDLGNVTCGRWDTTRPRQVCSPWHPAMNVSLVCTGLLLALGALLAGRAIGRGPARWATQLLVLAGAGGYALAGWYPADVNENNHFLAALLIFALGNASMVTAAFARRSPLLAPMRGLSLTLGVTGIAGTALFLAQVDLGIGVGGMERVAVFPLLVWAFAVGLRLLRVGAPVRDKPSRAGTGLRPDSYR